MKTSRHIWLLALSAICVVGCTRTYIGDGPGTPSPDGQLRLSVTSHGAYGRSYVDKTKKEVWVSLWRGDANTPIFQQHYRVVGSDVSWDTRWTSASNVVVQFFDYGDGVTIDDAAPSTPKHQIRRIQFHVDGHTGKVSEVKDSGIMDFSKASPTEIVVGCIFFAWAIISFAFWCKGFGKEPKASSALQIILKHAPRWWRAVTWCVFALVFISLLLSLILKR